MARLTATDVPPSHPSPSSRPAARAGVSGKSKRVAARGTPSIFAPLRPAPPSPAQRGIPQITVAPPVTRAARQHTGCPTKAPTHSKGSPSLFTPHHQIKQNPCPAPRQINTQRGGAPSALHLLSASPLCTPAPLGSRTRCTWPSSHIVIQHSSHKSASLLCLCQRHGLEYIRESRRPRCDHAFVSEAIYATPVLFLTQCLCSWSARPLQ